MAQVDGEVKLGVSIDTSNVKQNADKLAKSIQNVFSNYSRDSKSANANLMSLQHQMAKYSNDLNRAYEKQKQLASQKMPTQQYLDTEKALAQSTAQANKLSVALEQMRSKAVAEGKDVKDIKDFTRLEEQYKKVNVEAKNYETTLNRLKTTGTGYTKGVDTAEYAKATSDVQRLQNKLAELNTRYNQVGNTSKRSGKELLESFKSPFKHLGNLISRLRQLKNQSKNAFGGMAKNAKKSFMTVLKYAFGIRSIFILFKRLKAATKDAFTAMSANVPRVRDEMASLSASFGQVKNSLATAFQPIFSYVVPALNALASALVTAMNALANFFATFTGQKVIYKAAKANNNLAKSYGGAGGAAKDAAEDIAEYDKLIVLNQDNAGGGGGGGGSADSNAGLFEEVPAEPSKLAEMIKEAWKDADFTEVGALIGSKLVSAMESIDWDKYKKTGKKIGKSVATFLNGVFETPNLFSDVGKTIAEALNVKFATLGSFASNFHWDSLGKGMADSINSFFRTFDFPQLAQTIHDTIVGVLTTAGTFFRETDFEEIGNKLGTFINDLDLPDILSTLGQTIHDGIIGAIDLAIGFFSTVDFKELGKAIGEFINKIDVADLLLNLSELALNILVALKDAIIGLGEENPLAAAIITLLIGIKVAGKLGKLANAIGSSLAGSIIQGTAGSSISSSFGTLFAVGGVVFSSIVAGIAGWNLGQYIYNSAKKDENGDNWIDRMMMDLWGDPKEAAKSGKKWTIKDMILHRLGATESGVNPGADIAYDVMSTIFGSPDKDTHSESDIVFQQELNRLLKERGITERYSAEGAEAYKKAVQDAMIYEEAYTKALKSGCKESEAHKKASEALAKTTDKKLTPSFKTLRDSLSKAQKGQIDVTNSTKELTPAYKDFHDSLVKTIVDTNSAISTIGTTSSQTKRDVGASVSGMNGEFKSAHTNILGNVQLINKDITDNFNSAQVSASNDMNLLKDNTVKAMSGAYDTSSKHSSWIWNIVTTNLKGMLDGAVPFLSNFATNTATYMNQAYDTTDKHTQWMWGKAVSNLDEMSSKSKTPLSSFVSNVATGMSNALATITGEETKWSSTGDYLVQGLMRGIQAKWNRTDNQGLRGLVASLASGLTAALNKVLRVESPSKEWAETGNYLTLGLMVGIESNEQRLLRTIKDMATDVNDTLQGSLQSSIELPDIVQGKVIPAGMNYSIQANRQSQEDTDIRSMIREELANISMPERIAVELADGRVIAETVWDEEKKMYKQLGYSPRLA